jgi:cardiolipin synthase
MKKLGARKKKWIERTIANDRSYKAYLYNRLFLFMLAVLAQMLGYALILLLIVYDSAYAFGLEILVGVMALIFVLLIISGNDRPSSKLSWVVMILVAPVFGVPMYLVNGRGRPTKRMRKKIDASKAENAEKLGEMQEFIPSTRADTVCRYIQNYGGYPVFLSGDVEYYKSGEDMFPHMLETLKGAETFILLEYFIIANGKMWNEIRKVLLEKAACGVKIYIIYDDFGCMVTLPPKYDEYLESLSENIRCMPFNEVVPLFAVRMNNRDHRKMLVVDGKTAFTGGINLADEYIGEKRRFGYWKDSGLKITGAPVRSFVQAFAYMWNAFRADKMDIHAFLQPVQDTADMDTGVRIQPYDDSPLDQISVGETVYVDMINRAKDSVYIFTPYLVLDDFLRAALCSAAMRGVDVRIVTPGVPDKKTTYRLTRANYEILMKAGVKIYEYTPGFVHAKMFVADGKIATVGTVNLDYRSLYLHFECGVILYGTKTVQTIREDVLATLAVHRKFRQKT